MLRHPSGCFTQYEVNIGYYPKRLSREATLRDGPGEQFRILERLAAGQRVGRQSVRNPQRSSTPSRRDARNGYAWVYALEGRRSGWVRADVLLTDPGGWGRRPRARRLRSAQRPACATRRAAGRARASRSAAA